MKKNALKCCDKTKRQQKASLKSDKQSLVHSHLEKIKEAHSCKKSEGKIIAIGMDELGNTYCAYCHQKVDYPKVTKEEIEEIKEYIKNEKRNRM